MFPTIHDGAVHIDARGDYGRLRLAPGQSAESETLAIGGFDDTRLGLEAWADSVARHYAIKLPSPPAGFCTWYAEKHGGSSDEKDLAGLTEFAAKNLRPFGFDFVQIDDGWQRGDSQGNGPNKNFTDFRPDGPYPAGMKKIADDINAHGLTAGLWFMPFAGTANDPWFVGHTDWFVKRADGAPYTTNWGGTSLDMTNPAARAYVRSFVSNIAKWGFTYFKMDGLYTGVAAKQVYVNSGYKEDDLGDAVFLNPGKTNTEAFRDGLKLVREAAGPDVFFLGCTVAQNMRSYTGAMGLVDAMRIGADNSGSWAGWVRQSPVAGSRNYFLNDRIWYNDPDPSYVRSSLSLTEARTIASWPTIAGALNSNGDWLPSLPAERLDILKRTLPSHGRIARPVDLFESDPPRVWAVTDDGDTVRRDVIALFNWDDVDTDFDVPVARLGLPPARTYVGFDYWANTFLPPFHDHLRAALPAHGCEILSARPLQDHPFLLSTSRHITQGMTDVLAESWNGHALTGRSRVVGGDAYELRLCAPEAPHPWRLTRVTVNAADTEAGVRVTYAQDGTGVRATLVAAESRIVKWRAAFE